jgi:hypothetical protein
MILLIRVSADADGSRPILFSSLSKVSGLLSGKMNSEAGLAEAHGPRLHGRRDEEGRAHRRVLQIGKGRPHTYRINQCPRRSALLARPAPAAVGFSDFVRSARAPFARDGSLEAETTAPSPSHRGPSVAQRWLTLSVARSSHKSAERRRAPGGTRGCPDARHSPFILKLRLLHAPVSVHVTTAPRLKTEGRSLQPQFPYVLVRDIRGSNHCTAATEHRRQLHSVHRPRRQ